MTRQVRRNSVLSVVVPFIAILIAITAQASTQPLFLPPVAHGSGGDDPGPLAVADLNGDGNPDLVVLNSYYPGSGLSNGLVSVQLGNGDGPIRSLFR